MRMSDDPKPRRGFSIVPFLGDLLVLTRVLRDRDAAWWLKLLAFLTTAYVISPIDAFPEAIAPFVGWIEDVGLVLALRVMLASRLDPYRYPMFEKPPQRLPTPLGQVPAG